MQVPSGSRSTTWLSQILSNSVRGLLPDIAYFLPLRLGRYSLGGDSATGETATCVSATGVSATGTGATGVSALATAVVTAVGAPRAFSAMRADLPERPRR